MARNPMKDQVAIVGVGVAPYSRENTQRSIGAMTLDACINAARDAGVSASDIDGISAQSVTAQYLQPALGIPELTWWFNSWLPFSNQLDAAIRAVATGGCEVCLVSHSQLVGPGLSRAAAADPFRVRQGLGKPEISAFLGAGHVVMEPHSVFGVAGYAAWANKYLHDFGAKREYLGYVAINARSNAARNDNAVMRKPLTMDEYLAGRMIREPLCMYDMDIPTDGADAFIVTTAERARDMAQPAVLVHAAAAGQAATSSEEHTPDFDHTSQVITARGLWERSDLGLNELDVYCLYDGFTIITLNWLENMGFCGRGEAGLFLEANWDKEEQRIRLDGHARLNPHGGNLAEGHTDGTGHTREAVLQLQGRAGPRQIPDATSALLTIGGLFSTKLGAFILRRAD